MKVISDGLLSPLIVNGMFQGNNSRVSNFNFEVDVFSQKGRVLQRTGGSHTMAPT
jgi:hypothetical protein